jgi:hypothetical protein
MQYVEIGNFDLGEINFVGKGMTRATPRNPKVEILKTIGVHFP